MAAPATIHFHSRTFIHTFHPIRGVLVFVLYITSLPTNEIGRYLTYLKYPPERKSSARGTLTLYAIVDDDNFLGPYMYFL